MEIASAGRSSSTRGCGEGSCGAGLAAAACGAAGAAGGVGSAGLAEDVEGVVAQQRRARGGWAGDAGQGVGGAGAGWDVERELALVFAAAQAEADLGDAQGERDEGDGLDADAEGVAGAEVAELGVVLGVEGRDAGFDRVAGDLAAGAACLGDERVEVVVDPRELAVAAARDGGADLGEPPADGVCAPAGEDAGRAGSALGVAGGGRASVVAGDDAGERGGDLGVGLGAGGPVGDDEDHAFVAIVGLGDPAEHAGEVGGRGVGDAEHIGDAVADGDAVGDSLGGGEPGRLGLPRDARDGHARADVGDQAIEQGRAEAAGDVIGARCGREGDRLGDGELAGERAGQHRERAVAVALDQGAARGELVGGEPQRVEGRGVDHASNSLPNSA